MKKLVYVFLVFVLIFVWNIWIYFISEDYRFFIKKLKYGDEVIYLNAQVITDEYNFPENENNNSNQEVNVSVDVKQSSVDTTGWLNSSTTQEIGSWTNNVNQAIDENVEKTRELDYFENVFLLEFKSYVLKNDDSYSDSLFSLTRQYPEQYFEYSSDSFTVYLFWQWKYNQVYSFFQDNAYNLNSSLKEVNNFWQRSSYLNLDENDPFVRIIMEENGFTYGLKIHKDMYGVIKNILK